MRKPTLFLFLFTLFLGSTRLVACDDNDMEDDRIWVQEFMQRAAASDLFEIETGQMAASKGAVAETRTFGQELVRDHTLSSNEMKALATQKNIPLPTGLPADKAALRDELNGLTGMAFDRRFAAIQVMAHEEAVTLFETANNTMEDDQVEAFIEKTLPVLRMHLQHARTHQTMVNAM